MRVLAIDGGGIRGLIPALVLAELERCAGKPIAQLFDLIAGTSTGGILACALGKPGPPSARDLAALYREEGPKIFRRSLGQRLASAEGLLEEKHDDDALNAALRRWLGATHLAGCETRLLVTAYDLEAREPYFFKSWRPERDAPLTQVARATAAAPTYFEPVRLGDRSLADGGVFANNPAMCAFAEAQRLAPGPHLVVSLGTGQQTRPIRHEDAAGWGLVQWVRPVIDVVFDGVADTVDYQLRHLCETGDYVRLQTVLDRASDALDDASPRNLDALQRQAEELIARERGTIDDLCRRLTA